MASVLPIGVFRGMAAVCAKRRPPIRERLAPGRPLVIEPFVVANLDRAPRIDLLAGGIVCLMLFLGSFAWGGFVWPR